MNGDNAPAASIDLSEGEAEAFDSLLSRMKAVAEGRALIARAELLAAATDAELITQLQMKLRGEPTNDRHQFVTQREIIARLLADQRGGAG